MKKLTLILAVVFMLACKHSQKIGQPTVSNKPMMIDGKLFAALYQQRSADYMALSMQSYQWAAERLLSYKPVDARPMAIITDIDETVLNNARYAVQQALVGKDYDLNSWKAWTAKAEADTIAGAYGFLKLAATKGVEIFYITNRDADERPGTLKNLQKFNLPYADDLHLMTKEGKSSKEERRLRIAKKYQIVLLIGDNLADFSSLFDKKLLEERKQNLMSVKDAFGSRFIVIPNNVYGDWEGAMYQYNHNFNLQQKDSAYRKMLVE